MVALTLTKRMSATTIGSTEGFPDEFFKLDGCVVLISNKSSARVGRDANHSGKS